MPWADGDNVTSTNLNAKSGSVFNVKDEDYGAKGDGITDDAAAFRLAIAAASAVSGGVVHIPSTASGYIINSQIQIPEGVRLQGSSQPAFRSSINTDIGTRLVAGSAVTRLLFASNARGVSVRDVVVDLSLTDNTNQPVGLSLEGCWYFDVSNVIVNDMSGNSNAGVRLKNSDSRGCYWGSLRNVVVVGEPSGDSDGARYGSGFSLTGSGNDRVNQTTFINCRANRCNRGFDLDHCGGGLVFLSCTAEGNVLDGVQVTDHATTSYPAFVGGEFNTNEQSGVSGTALLINAVRASGNEGGTGSGDAVYWLTNGARSLHLISDGRLEYTGVVRPTGYEDEYAASTVTQKATTLSAATTLLRVATDVGEYALTNAPQIDAGVTGRRLRLVGTSNTDYVALSSGSSLALRTQRFTLRQDSWIDLEYFGSVGVGAYNNQWVEVARSANQGRVHRVNNTDAAISPGDHLDHIFISTGGTGKTVTLPSTASSSLGQTYTIKKTDSGGGTVTIDGNGNNIDGSATTVLASQYSFMQLTSDGTQWYVTARG